VRGPRLPALNIPRGNPVEKLWITAQPSKAATLGKPLEQMRNNPVIGITQPIPHAE
jgi:hypothetical protein